MIDKDILSKIISSGSLNTVCPFTFPIVTYYTASFNTLPSIHLFDRSVLLHFESFIHKGFELDKIKIIWKNSNDNKGSSEIHVYEYNHNGEHGIVELTIESKPASDFKSGNYPMDELGNIKVITKIFLLYNPVIGIPQPILYANQISKLNAS